MICAKKYVANEYQCRVNKCSKKTEKLYIYVIF